MYFDHCDSPQALGKAIGELLEGVTFKTIDLAGSASGAIPLIGEREDQTLREAFQEARSRAELLRQERPDLLDVPGPRFMPLAGLRQMFEWCRVSGAKWKPVDLKEAGQGEASSDLASGEKTDNTPAVTENEAEVLDYLNGEFPQLRTVTQAAEATNRDRKTIRERLLTLVDKGLVSAQKDKKSTQYVITASGRDYMAKYFS